MEGILVIRDIDRSIIFFDDIFQCFQSDTVGRRVLFVCDKGLFFSYDIVDLRVDDIVAEEIPP